MSDILKKIYKVKDKKKKINKAFLTNFKGYQVLFLKLKKNKKKKI